MPQGPLAFETHRLNLKTRGCLHPVSGLPPKSFANPSGAIAGVGLVHVGNHAWS